MLPKIEIPDCTYIGAFLTLRCNYNCSYCINKHGDFKPRHEMTGQEWCQGLNRLVIDRKQMVPVTLQGGEPTVHREWPEIIEGIKEDLYIDILTNMTFDLDEFMIAAPPARWERDVPYPTIRVSYHPEFAKFDRLLDRVSRLDLWGYPVGVFVVAHPSVDVEPLKNKAKRMGLDFRTKEFLGWFEGRLYGKYRYQTLGGKRVRCRSHELLIAPDGNIHRCHRDLYSGDNSVGHILDPSLKIEFKFRPCDNPQCNECDLKLKNNRFQQFGSCSVEIENI